MQRELHRPFPGRKNHPTLRREGAKLFLTKMETQEILRAIRKEFFAYRNGIVADKLRKAGDPHPMIMGCLLADVMEITNRTRDAIDDKAQRQALARELWNDTNSRECRLAAPMLYPAEFMSLDEAAEWCSGIESVEIADNLCHKLLRHTAEADALFRKLIAQEQTMVKYTGYRLLLNLLLGGKVQATPSLKSIVEAEAAHAQPQLTALLRDVLEEFQ